METPTHTTETGQAGATEPKINPTNIGANTFRLYLLDPDSDPMNPSTLVAFKKADSATDIQKRVRALLNKEETVPEGEALYADEGCTDEIELAPDHSWMLTVIRKTGRTSQKNVLDKLWVAGVLSDPNLTAEEKIAKIQGFV